MAVVVEGEQALVELKKTLKRWESEFREQHKRKPGRDDIATAPPHVQDSYSKYSQLKKNQTKLNNSLSTAGDQGKTSHEDPSRRSRADARKDRETSDSPDDSHERRSDETGSANRPVADDVWGAHLNRSSEEKSTGVDKEAVAQEGKKKESLLKMYSKKLYSNTEGKNCMARGPRHSKPVSEKQSFWSKETSREKSRDGSKPQNQTEATLHEDQESPGHQTFFGTKLSSRNIKLGSCIGNRASLDPATVFSAGLPKARRYSLQNDWLTKCEKENKIDHIPSPKDVDEVQPPRGRAASMKTQRVSASQSTKGPREDSSPDDKSETELTAVTERAALSVDSKEFHKLEMERNFPEESGVEIKTVSQMHDKVTNNALHEQSRAVSLKPGKRDEFVSNGDACSEHETHSSLKTTKSSVREVQETAQSQYSAEQPLKKHAPDSQGSSGGLAGRTQDDVEESKRRKRSIASPSAPPTKRHKTVERQHSHEEDGGPDETNQTSEIGDDQEEGSQTKIKKKKKVTSASRSANPSLNENFVRLNMLTKSYRRKGRGMKGEAYKRMMWKQKTGAGGWRGGGRGGRGGGGGRRGGFKARGMNEGTDKCFKCGGTGHWASKCTGIGGAKKKACEAEPEDAESVMGPLPTLEEAALAAAGTKPQPGSLSGEGRGDHFEPLSIATPIYESQLAPLSLQPLYPPTQQGIPDATPDAVYDALRKMGYETFRPGQEGAIMRILSGLSTLVVLSTGAGKSLCYQLPAYMYNQRSPAITLVISPLVSLMEDQVLGLPRFLKGARLHSHMTKPQRDKVHAEIEAGKIQILLVSPEAVVGGGTNCLPHASKMPPIAFACVDEAHCISEWSHNFRPSYLMLCKVLKERLGVHCILALTATATKTTSDSVAHHLGIADQPGAVIRGCSVPSNLLLSVSKDHNREKALIELLKGERFRRLKSVIVYCIRREETERVASLIRTCLQMEPWSDEEEEGEEGEEGDDLGDDGKGTKMKEKETKKTGYKKKMKRSKKKFKLEANSCEAYHAGMSPAERRRVQNAFMSGNLRIVVATVAFGMGLDKADVRAVIHFNMPRTFESFVQEIGRAGRDGLPAHCHSYLDETGSDVWELRRHTNGNYVDRFTVKKLVRKIFKPCKCNQIHRLNPDDDTVEDYEDRARSICPGHWASMTVDETVQELDIKEEGLATLLCYLELHPSRWVVTRPHTYTTCTLNFYGGPRELHACALKSPALAAALARDRIGAGKKKAGREDSERTSLTFDVVELASAMGWDLAPVKRELRQLQWKHDKIKGWVRTGVMVEFTDLAFSYRCRGNLSDSELDSVVEFLHGRVEGLQKRELGQLSSIYSALESVSKRSYAECCDEVDHGLSEQLRQHLISYFVEELDVTQTPDDVQDKEVAFDEGRIRMTIRQFISVNHDRAFTGRAVARILQGIASPCFPAHVWGRDRRFWRCFLEVDFRTLIKIANEEVMKMR